MSRYLIFILLLFIFFWSQSSFAQNLIINNTADAQNYSLGYRFGRSLLNYGIEFRSEVFWHGLFAPIDEMTPQFDRSQMKKVLSQLETQRALPRLPEQLQQQRIEVQNYSLGYRLGNDLLQYKVELKPQFLLNGIFDAYTNRKPQLQLEEMAGIIRQLNDRKNERLQLPEVQHFLSSIAASGDVTFLKSGLQYRVIKEGSGRTPQKEDTVRLHFRNSTIHGFEIDSSYPLGIPAPRTYKIEDVIPGWAEALFGMKEGSKWTLYIPAYLTVEPGSPTAGQTMITDLELIEVL
ncbi:MAG TPA: FKBP-type peptidyl-prolyl cis-trans isomerase N-terminal domain-containing protein [Geopsychrobacteraceae bacterium]|nr:FKBP-type peptidyl-prolyl cis-trans isomerase N-terminal domain-containing protein [Geopsychrobacteraceae bacterium]